MKILSVHNLYQQPGGEDQVFAQEASLLRSYGHQVVIYQASNDQVTGANRLVLLRNTIWNPQTHQELGALMQRERPDIVHVHNTFPVISPAVYYAAKEEGIPVVQTLHNYRLLCPTATLFRDGHVCQDCVGRGTPWPGVIHGCYRGSRLATAAAAAMLATHHYKQTWSKTVSAYIALSGFARDKFIQGGLPAGKIFVKPNFLESDPGRGEARGNYALFVGTIDPGKRYQHAAGSVAGTGARVAPADRWRWSDGAGGGESRPWQRPCDLAKVAPESGNAQKDEGCVGAYPALNLV